MQKATYERPVVATLYVHLDNGETWEAMPEDLERFNMVYRHNAYMKFNDAYSKALRAKEGLVGRDITDAHLNPLRYLVETAVVHPDLLDHPEHEGWKDVTELERRLDEFTRLHDAASLLADRWESSKQMRIDLTDRFGPIAQIIANLVALVGTESGPKEGSCDA
jgi:hypothetical protein